MLRGLDLDGVPILFHAASNGRKDSFEAVWEQLRRTLGKRGATLQLDPEDLPRKETFLMYAVRGGNVEVSRLMAAGGKG